MKKQRDYALYHGDTFIALGTKEYLAQYLGISVKTIDHYMSPYYKKKTKMLGYNVTRIEEEK